MNPRTTAVGSRRDADGSSGARGFTLLELLVTMALVLVIMASLSKIFSITSEAAAATAADADLLAASAAFRETVSDQITKMAEGLLVIDCPAPTSPRAEVPRGERFLRLRHDRLVFMTNGDIDEYQSFTDPGQGDPTIEEYKTASSSQALVYFGPGIPLTDESGAFQEQPLDEDTDALSFFLTAKEWVFLHRSILLMPDAPAPANPAWSPFTMDDLIGASGMLNGGPLPNSLATGLMDTVITNALGTLPANTSTISDLLLKLTAWPVGEPLPSDLEMPIAGLWEPSRAPRTISLVFRRAPDHFIRGGSSFVRGLADFRIEWTDGKPVSGANGPTRWFGLRPDPDFNVDANALDNMDTTRIPNVADLRQQTIGNTTPEEAEAFGTDTGILDDNRIEWTNAIDAPDADAAYRAIWRADTWAFRPKALRFTYRLYSTGKRLKHTAEIDLDEDGDFDPDDAPGTADVTRRVVTRYGRPFSIVVKVP